MSRSRLAWTGPLVCAAGLLLPAWADAQTRPQVQYISASYIRIVQRPAFDFRARMLCAERFEFAPAPAVLQPRWTAPLESNGFQPVSYLEALGDTAPLHIHPVQATNVISDVWCIDREQCARLLPRERVWQGMQTMFCEDLLNDFRNNYDCESLTKMLLSVAAVAPLANTSFDRRAQDWYHRRVRSDNAAVNELARVSKEFGNYKLMVPIYLGFTFTGWLVNDEGVLGVTGEWSRRTLRAMMVGAPAVGVLQYSLGGHRPDEGSSYWSPFQDTNGVAGHGFIGALPFLAAASMAEHPLAKTMFFAGSFLTCWSRVHHDAHYFSQAALGWCLAYVATQSINQTEQQRWQIVPMVDSSAVGIQVFFHY